MATPIPRGAQPHLSAVSQHLAQFTEDQAIGFGLPILASDLRDLAAAATRASEECMAEYSRTLTERRVGNGT